MLELDWLELAELVRAAREVNAGKRRLAGLAAGTARAFVVQTVTIKRTTER